MTLAYHIYSSPRLVSSLHESMAQLPTHPTVKDLESIPLLLSMYAETLRFGVQIHIPRSAPFRTLTIGGIDIPNNKLMMANTWLAHTDEQVWNTKDGKHPLDHFWPERFLIDPSDPTSGPTKKGICGSQPNEVEDKDTTFSIEGLEGSWIPFGGMYHGSPRLTCFLVLTSYLTRRLTRLPWTTSRQTNHAFVCSSSTSKVRYRIP